MDPFKKPGSTITGLSLLITIGFFIAVSWSCSWHKQILLKQLSENPIRNIDYWGDRWRQTFWFERVWAAHKELIEYLYIENRLYDLSEKPVAVEPAPEFFEAVKIINFQLPTPVKDQIEERFIGMFSVRDLGSSGFAEAITDKDGYETYAIIVLDRDLLLKKKPMNGLPGKKTVFLNRKRQTVSN